MKKSEWLEYFQLVNEREPNEEELAQALSAGEFQEEVSESIEAPVSENAPESESLTDSQSEDFSKISVQVFTAKKKYCIQCGSELSAEAKFCTKCGAAQDGSSPTPTQNMINRAELQKTAMGYWSWLKKVMKRPVSTATSEMSNNYMWITFAIIMGFLSIGFAIMFGSFPFFFIVAIVGGGIGLFSNWLYGLLANGLMKTKFKFFDVFKMNMQASIYAVPISVVVFIFCVLGKLSLNSAVRPAQAGLYGGTTNVTNAFSALTGLSFLGLIIYVMLAFAALVSGDLFIMALYRETLAVEGSKIDNYPWFKLLYVIVIFVLVFILFLILGAVLLGSISNTVLNIGY